MILKRPMKIDVHEGLRLELLDDEHAEALFRAVDANRNHLSTYLPWVNDMRSIADFYDYIKGCELLTLQGKEVSFVIIYNEVLVGRIGLHHINRQNKNAAIGYWLTANVQGKGIMLAACKAIISYGFQVAHLHRIEIKAAVENLRSQAIPQKLHFKKEGILRQAELVNDRYLDLVLYALVKADWLANK